MTKDYTKKIKIQGFNEKWKLRIHSKLFLYLTFSFIIFTVIGTIAHEFGHYFAAKSVGIEASVHYGYTNWSKTNAEQWNKVTKMEKTWITFGGPLQTMLTGTIGFILLVIKRASFRGSITLGFLQWLMVFLTFFWSRQICNLAVTMISNNPTGRKGIRSDEYKLNLALNLPDNTIEITTSSIAFLICFLVTFWFVPKSQRLTFIFSGFLGGILGYLFWLKWFGPIVMP